MVKTTLLDGNNLPLTIWGIPIVPLLAGVLLGLRGCIGYSALSAILLIAVVTQSQEFAQRVPLNHELITWFSLRWIILVTFGAIAAYAIHRANARTKTYLEQTGELEVQARLAHEAQTSKSLLLAQMSHEVRTPMNGIVGVTHYLETHVFDPTVRPAIQSMAKCANELMTLLNRILDLSKLESGQLSIHPKQTDLGALISQTVAEHQDPTDEQRRFKVDLHRAENPGFVDAGRLRQIIHELLTASASSDAQGLLSVELKCQDDPLDPDLLRYQVLVRNHNAIDQSASILVTSTELLSLDPLDQDSHTSMDLGLSLAAQLAERLGGCIAMNALKQERGSFVLHLTLPTKKPKTNNKSHKKDANDGLPLNQSLESRTDDAPTLGYWQKGLITSTEAKVKHRLLIYNIAYTSVLAYYLWLSLDRGYQKNALLTGLGIIMAVGIAIAAGRGYARAAASSFLCVFTSIVSTLALFNGQIFSQTAWLLNLVPVMAAQLLGLRAALWSVAATTLGLLMLFIGQTYVPIESEFIRSSSDSLFYLTTYTSLFFLLAAHGTMTTQKEELYLQSGHQACAIAQAQAQAANELKEKFIEDISYKIRTPMNGIMGLAAHLVGQDSLAAQRESLSTINRCGVHLKTLLDHIFRNERADALVNEAFDLPQLLGDVQQLYSVQAQQKGLEIEVKGPIPSNSYTFLGNPTALLQILSNLVSNAIKFSDQGKITIALIQGPAQLTSPHPLRSFRIEVRDQGLGLTNVQCKKIFEHYQQVESEAHRNRGGTGLGLAISRDLARRMGGELSVVSQPGKGSVFSVGLTLPEPAPHAPAPTVTPSPTHKKSGCPGAKVLVVDDNQINQRVAGLQLRALGCKVEFASNGEIAVAMHRNEHWDLILMDLRMPVMNGLDATRAIRNQEDPEKRVPIVALTANDFGEQRQACLDAGMNGYLTKPFRAKELEATVQSHYQPSAKAA